MQNHYNITYTLLFIILSFDAFSQHQTNKKLFINPTFSFNGLIGCGLNVKKEIYDQEGIFRHSYLEGEFRYNFLLPINNSISLGNIYANKENIPKGDIDSMFIFIEKNNVTNILIAYQRGFSTSNGEIKHTVSIGINYNRLSIKGNVKSIAQEIAIDNYQAFLSPEELGMIQGEIKGYLIAPCIRYGLLINLFKQTLEFNASLLFKSNINFLSYKNYNTTIRASGLLSPTNYYERDEMSQSDLINKFINTEFPVLPNFSIKYIIPL